MGAPEWVALGATLVAIFGSIGAVVKWAAGKFERQADKLERLTLDHIALQRENGLLLIRIQKTQLAFQMVATELSRKSPGNHALSLAKSLLDEAFKVDAAIPSDMAAELGKLDAE